MPRHHRGILARVPSRITSTRINNSIRVPVVVVDTLDATVGVNNTQQGSIVVLPVVRTWCHVTSSQAGDNDSTKGHLVVALFKFCCSRTTAYRHATGTPTFLTITESTARTRGTHASSLLVLLPAKKRRRSSIPTVTVHFACTCFLNSSSEGFLRIPSLS